MNNNDNLNNQHLENNMENNIEQKVENKKARKKILAFAVTLALIGGAYGAYWHFYGSHFQETENAYISGLQNTVTSQVTGNIVEINIQDSQHVKKGMVALTIDSTDYQLNLDKAENDLARTVRSYRSLQIGKNQNNENLSLKRLDLAKAQSDYYKDQKAFEAGVLSKEQLDNSLHLLNQSKVALSNANLGLQNAKLQAVAKNIYEHPDVAQAILQYKSAYLDLNRTKITIPTDGIIAKKGVYIGQRVSPNQPLFTVVDVNHEWVDANFKESQLKHIKIGQQVVMHSDVNGKEYQGVISGIGAGSGSSLSLLPAQNATGNWIKVVQRVPVRIEISSESLKENGFLPIGTSMRAEVKLNAPLKTVSSFTQKNPVIFDEPKMHTKINEIIENNLGNK